MLMESLSEQNAEKIYGYLKSEDLIYKLDNITNIIGRDTNCTIVLNHPSISKQHAKIEIDVQSSFNAFLTDLNSTHGTFINDMKLSQNQSIKLKSGDVLSFGQSDIKYTFLNYKPRNELGFNNSNNFDYKIKDNKISLVNETEYENASMNHFNGMNLNPNNKLNSIKYNNLINLNLNNLDNNEDDKVNINNNKNGINDMNNNNEEENIENIDEELINSQDNYINNNNFKINPNNQNKNQMTQIIEESNPDMQSNTLLLSSNNFNNQKIPKINTNQTQGNQNPSLYQEIYNKNNLLQIELKSKNNEIKNLTSLYNQLQDNYNKLNAKHNALMIYASDIQKKNDVLELEIQEKNIIISESNLSKENKDEIEPKINMNKLLNEKEAMIAHLQEENQLYKNNLEKIKQKLIGGGDAQTLENQNISSLIDKLNNEYLSEAIKYKQIINKYLSYETTCSKKWNELIMANDTLKEKLRTLNNNWNEDIKKYNNILRNNDIRLQSALEKISDKIGGNFNIKKEEAAKFLVEQTRIIFGEKEHLIKENSILNKKNSELEIENNKLKDEITQMELERKNGDNKALLAKIEELKDAIKKKDIMYEPEKIINYQNIILELDLKNKEKDKLIINYKNKMDNFLKNNTFLNFDDREVVNSVSRVLNQKDQVIQSLKNKIIDNEINNEIINDNKFKK